MRFGNNLSLHSTQQKWWDNRANKYYEEMALSKEVQQYIIEKRAHYIIKIINNADKVLDIGVGTGSILTKVIEKKEINLYGVDCSYKMVEVAKKNLCKQRNNLIQADALYLPFKDKIFDVIICFDIIHHLAFENMEYIEYLILETKRVTKLDGLILIFEANPINFYWYYYMWATKEFNAKLLLKRNLEKLLTKNGFDIVDSKYCGFMPNFARNGLFLLFSFFENLIETFPIIKMLCSNYVLIVKNKGYN